MKTFRHLLLDELAVVDAVLRERDEERGHPGHAAPTGRDPGRTKRGWEAAPGRTEQVVEAQRAPGLLDAQGEGVVA